MYEDKDCRDLESTSKLRGVEVKIRPCIHEMEFDHFVETLLLFCKYFDIENSYIFCK